MQSLSSFIYIMQISILGCLSENNSINFPVSAKAKNMTYNVTNTHEGLFKGSSICEVLTLVG